jgi:hypothetical protein
MNKRFVLSVAAVLCGMRCGTTTSTPDSGASGGGFQVTVSGEGFASEGIAFPAPAGSEEPFFQDGWDVKFESVVASIGNVTISEEPDRNAADQSQTGPVVAELSGPWIVDLAKDSPLVAKEMNGKAFELGSIANQNKKGGASFNANDKYAFGYSLLKATPNSTNVNQVDAATVATMQAKGYALWIKGTATFKGENCRSTVASYNFNTLPKKVNFAFGYSIPTVFKNCINPELSTKDARGIQVRTGAPTVAQITLHLDHAFWESLEEDAPLRWDLIASRKALTPGADSISVTDEDLKGVSFEAPKDSAGAALPWRYCGAAQSSDRTSGTVSYDPKGVPVSAAGGEAGLKDLYDYMQYNLSTFGHLNNDGLCFPERQFPAPK